MAELVVPRRVVKVKLVNSGHSAEPSEKKTKSPSLIQEKNMKNNRIANWDIVPNEIRMNIVRYMNKETRNSFRQCSKNCKDLIENTKLTFLKKFFIKYSSSKWIWGSQDEVFESQSFEAARACITKTLKNIDYVETFTVDMDYSTREFDTLPCGTSLMNVEQLRFIHPYFCSGMLKQFNPYYLSQIELQFKQTDHGIRQMVYDLPQIRLPKKVEILEYSTIRDDQLLQLEATVLKIEGATNLTKRGVAQYITKCLYKLNTKNFLIEIGFHGSKHHKLLGGFSFTTVEKRRRRPSYLESKPFLEAPCDAILASVYPEYALAVHEKWIKDDNIILTAQRINLSEYDF